MPKVLEVQSPLGGPPQSGESLFRVVAPIQKRIQGIVVTSFRGEEADTEFGIATVELIFDGTAAQLEVAKSPSLPFRAGVPPPERRVDTVTIADGEKVTGISGLITKPADGLEFGAVSLPTRITALFIHTNLRTVSVPDPSVHRGPVSFSFDLNDFAPAAAFVGFNGSVGGAEVAQLGPVRDTRSNSVFIHTLGIVGVEPAPASLGADVNLRWKDRSNRSAERDPAFAINTGQLFGDKQNPNFTNIQIFRVEQDDEHLRIFETNGKVNEFIYLGPDGDGLSSRYVDVADRNSRLTVSQSFGSAASRIDWGELSLEPFPPKPPSDNSMTWGDTFNLKESYGFTEVPYKGKDLSELDPRDLQVSNGQRSFIFKYPAANSKDFGPAEEGARAFAPHGTLFQTDNLSVQHGRTVSVKNGEEHQSTWSQSLGGSLTIGPTESPAFAFSSNTTYTNSVKEGMTHAGGYTISTGYFQEHSAVLDTARIQFDDAFLDDVNQLAEAVEENRPPDYARFIKNYGTHYAYAVVYGGLAYREMQFTRQALHEAAISGESVEDKVSGGIKDKLSVSVTSSSKNENQSSLEREVESQLETIVKVGGEPSEGPFQLANKAIPVLMDLRPIPDLLNVVYFTRKTVYTEVRAGLTQALLDYSNRFPFISARVGAPAVFEVEFTKFTPSRSSPDRRFSGAISVEVQGHANSQTQALINDPNVQVGDAAGLGELTPFLRHSFVFIDNNLRDISPVFGKGVTRRWSIGDGPRFSHELFVRVRFNLNQGPDANTGANSDTSDGILLPFKSFGPKRKVQTFLLKCSDGTSHSVELSFGNSGADPLLVDTGNIQPLS